MVFKLEILNDSFENILKLIILKRLLDNSWELIINNLALELNKKFYCYIIIIILFYYEY